MAKKVDAGRHYCIKFVEGLLKGGVKKGARIPVENFCLTVLHASPKERAGAENRTGVSIIDVLQKLTNQ